MIGVDIGDVKINTYRKDKNELFDVQMFVNGFWSYMHQSTWDDRDASVLCRQFGYNDGARDELRKTIRHYGKIFLVVRMHCTGLEEKLSECPYEVETTFVLEVIGVVSCRRGGYSARTWHRALNKIN